MGNKTTVVIILLLILVVSWLYWDQKEKLTDLDNATITLTSDGENQDDDTVVSAASPGSKPFVYLYEKFDRQGLAYALDPDINYENKIGNGFAREILKINLKSVDINLPKTNDPVYDQIRRVELWSIYDGDPNSSLESDFYNSYLEPEFALTGNPGKYKKVLRVLPGQHVVANFTEPIKKIWLIAVL